MTLTLYLARRFGTGLLVLLGFFALFQVLVNVIEQLRRFDVGTIGLTEAVILALLKMPADLYAILPLVTMLAALTLYLRLARSSELVVLRAAGLSALRSLLGPALSVVLFGMACVMVIHPIAIGLSKAHDARVAALSGRAENVLSVGSEGLWLRQAGETGQIVIQARRATPDGAELRDVTFLEFSPGGQPALRIDAERATLGPDGWVLHAAKRWELAPGGAPSPPEARASVHEALIIATDLTPERIRQGVDTAARTPLWALPAAIAELEAAGFSARAHRMGLHLALALPAVFLAMLLIGAALGMRHVRFVRTSLVVLIALGLGLGLQFLRDFAQVLGESGQIGPMLAAWSPPLAAILMALGLLFRLEDG